jgi:hypothetical protein
MASVLKVMATAWSDDEVQALREFSGSQIDCAAMLNRRFHRGRKVRTDASVWNKLFKLRRREAQQSPESAAPAVDSGAAPLPDTQWVEHNDKADVVVYSRDIRTLEQLNAYVNVDLGVWEPYHFEANKWEMGAKDAEGEVQTTPLFQIKAKYRKRAPLVVQLDQLRQDLLTDMRAEMQAYNRAIPRPLWVAGPSDVMAEFGLPDVHLNKAAWPDETGNAYDSDIAEAAFKGAVMDLLNKTRSFAPQRVLLPIGNDFYHIDNRLNTTTAGTYQDADTRYMRMIRRGRQLYVWAIRLLLQELGPVQTVSIPGNHDQISAMFLSELLSAQFEGHEHVTVDTGLYPRKYVRHGKVLLGFAHGHEEKVTDLPLLMAKEQRTHWAATTHHEWHLGHLHKIKETRFTAGDSFQGVRVRILPSLSGTDAWHARRGYTGEPRAAELYLWSARDGYVGHLNHVSVHHQEIQCLVA